jgi:hypothetical protein
MQHGTVVRQGAIIIKKKKKITKYVSSHLENRVLETQIFF